METMEKALIGGMMAIVMTAAAVVGMLSSLFRVTMRG
jgi:hypothetical protein